MSQHATSRWPLLRAPFPWPGGKSRAAHLVWERFGTVRRYIEPFCGSCAVLLAGLNRGLIAQPIVNDADGYIANFWRSLAYGGAREVATACDWPISEVDLHSRHAWLIQHRQEITEQLLGDPEWYDPKLAGWWAWGISQWIGGKWCADRSRKRPRLKGGAGTHRSKPGVSQDGNGTGVHGRKPRVVGGPVPPKRRPAICNTGGGHGVATSQHAQLRRWMGYLGRRLRPVRVLCGDWRRVVTSAVLSRTQPIGVLLDPPYSGALRDGELYAVDERDRESGLELSAAARVWAVDHGDKPALRIALCGLEGEHNDLEAHGWRKVAWSAQGGWGNCGKANGRGRRNAQRERIWFSPHCLEAQQGVLPGFEGAFDRLAGLPGEAAT